MCEAFQQNYAVAVNGFASDTSDLVPTMVVFDSTQCDGQHFPSDATPIPPTNPFVQTQTLHSADWGGFTIQSLVVPFNFVIVELVSVAGNTAQLLGPTFLPDLGLVRWQTGGTKPPTMTADPIATIQFASVSNWDFQVFSQCMGDLQFIGTTPLTRFTGQSERCDTFMPTQWCVGNNLTLYPNQCSCIVELPEIEAESQKLGVDLPVICFGQTCATTASYKTNNMMSKPCNITVCQQTISSTPGIINEGQDTVFCGGTFFNAAGNIVAPSITPLPPPSNAQQAGTPFYVWIMLGVSAILFAVLIYLLFSEKPKKETSVLRQIRKLQSKRTVFNPSNPSTLPTETASSPNTGLSSFT